MFWRLKVSRLVGKMVSEATGGIGSLSGWGVLFCLLLSLCMASVVRGELSNGEMFFEKEVRPVLVENCYECHSAGAERLKGNLRLDSLQGILEGGDSGPAALRRNARGSLLIEAVKYGNVDLQMPPKSRLREEEIAALTTWINMGMPWPEHLQNHLPAKEGDAGFPLMLRRQQHWAWQPIHQPELPRVKQKLWPASSVDYFLLARMEEQGLQPAPDADRRTLIRRVFLDLIGFPPTPEEMDLMLEETAEGWYEALVDRLLASPHFGERWARHWLDLVRYAETLGHEFDYEIPEAWRYRDYVVRAFNQDVPYNRFAQEHIAGDLLANPRINPATGDNESLLGTLSLWLGQQVHSPVDVRQYQADVVENQIDVLSKTFLGMTVACARCHNHKFDAISARDYYALEGILESSRFTLAPLSDPSRRREQLQRLLSLRREIMSQQASLWAASFNLERIAALCDEAWRSTGEQGEIEVAVLGGERDAERLDRWIRAVARIQQVSEGGYDSWKTPASTWVDFRRTGFDDWFTTGVAFGRAPTQWGHWAWKKAHEGNPREPSEDQPLWVPSGWAHSALLHTSLQGILRSPTFPIESDYIHLLVMGRESRLNVVVDGFTLIRNPIYGELKRLVNNDAPHWISIDVSMWKGHRAYLEFADTHTADFADQVQGGSYGRDGWIAVQQVVFSDAKRGPQSGSPAEVVVGQGFESKSSFRVQVVKTLRSFAKGEPGSLAQRSTLDWLVENDLLEPGFQDLPGEENCMASLRRQELACIQQLAGEVFVPAMTEGTPYNTPLAIRGNPNNPGEVVPRRFLEALGGEEIQETKSEGSGRLLLAYQLTSPENPLFSRVMVNRIWHYLMGRGIVASVDDFGVLGEDPTHPRLLDWLAADFRDSGWSMKHTVRQVVTSRAYRMSSRRRNSSSETLDPSNNWWHRMPVKRLEGEVIRDSILAVHKNLDRRVGGPSVPIHLTRFMEGRGRPSHSGPLDGKRRRSLYTEVRRNFLWPMMQVFDRPTPFTTVGRRTSSNVPAQALMLMNNPFVHEQAEHWAQKLLDMKLLSLQERINQAFRMAYQRPATQPELEEARRFLESQKIHYQDTGLEEKHPLAVWKDFCHVLFNSKEFLFNH